MAGKLRQYRPLDILGPEGVASASGQQTVADLKQTLAQWHGVVYQSDSSYRALFRRCGFSYQRTAKVFRSRSAEKVAAFEEQLEKNRWTFVWAPQSQTPLARTHPNKEFSMPQWLRMACYRRL